MYASKAGRLARFPEGERIEISEPYHRQVWELMLRIVSEICDSAVAKLD